MKFKITFLFLLVLAINSKSMAQSVYFVQFKINTISTAEEAKEIDDKISSKKGVVSTRADHITSTYFCSINSENIYSTDDFINWFKKLGYEISCFHSSSQGSSDLISPHELKMCEENNSP